MNILTYCLFHLHVSLRMGWSQTYITYAKVKEARYQSEVVEIKFPI